MLVPLSELDALRSEIKQGRADLDAMKSAVNKLYEVAEARRAVHATVVKDLPWFGE